MMRVIAGIALTFFASCGAYGQSAEAPPAFEVASIRPAAPPEPSRGMRVGRSGGPGTKDPTRVTYENFSLSNLVTEAYDIKRYQISGPSWLDSERFDVKAKVPEGATKEQYRLMLQNLLAERFKLTLHHDKKEMPMYELVVAKNGPKMKESVDDPAPKDDPAPASPPPSGPPKFTMDKDGYPVLPPGSGPMTIMMNGRARMQVSKMSMQDFAGRLSGQVSRPVTDATGLKGKYDFILSWAADGMGPRGPGGLMPPPPPPPEGGVPMASTPDLDSGPTLFAAIQQQLGLKLEPKKGLVDILVIDHMEKVPTEN